MQAKWYSSRFNGTCIFHLIHNWMWWCSQQTVHAFMLINDVIFIIIKMLKRSEHAVHQRICLLCGFTALSALCIITLPIRMIYLAMMLHAQTAHHFLRQGYYDLFQIIIKRSYLNNNEHLMLGLVLDLSLGLFSFFSFFAWIWIIFFLGVGTWCD